MTFIDKVENNTIYRKKKIFATLCVVFPILTVYSIYNFFEDFTPSFTRWFQPVMFIYFTFYYVKIYNSIKSKTGQFIIWYNDQIVFKLKEDISDITIYVKDISKIDTKIDTIEISTNKNELYKLDILDFKDFDERKRIKLNFEKLNNSIEK